MGRAGRRKRHAAIRRDADPARAGDGPDAPLIVVGGCPRSGTTLLRMMLDSHRRIACGPEFKALNLIAADGVRLLQRHRSTLEGVYGLEPAEVLQTFGEQIVALLEPWRRRSNKPRLAEKTPQNVHAFATLAEMLPDSPFVHLIRDGRDVVRSLLRQNWMDPATGRRVPYVDDPEEAARYWVQCVTDGRRLAAGPHRARYREVRYEDLVREPEATMRGLIDWLDEPWDPDVLAPHEQDHALPAAEAGSHGGALARPIHARAVGRWREEWTDAQRTAVERIAGPLLRELGYDD